MELSPHRIGQCGEIAASRYLRENGYDIVNANYRTKMGEIDIVAYDGKDLAIVEVKTRNDYTDAEPNEWVTKDKQNKIIMTALSFVKEYEYTGNVRFDVIEVFIEKGKNHNGAKINHIKNAFTTNEYFANI